MQKKWKKTKSKSAKSKKHKSKIEGKKRGKEGKSKREENEGKNWLVHLHLFCFLDLLLFCIYFAFCLEKCKKMPAKKANRKSKINAKKCKWTSPFLPMFFPFWRSFLFPIYFASGFFRFWSVAFWFSMWFPFLACFSSLKIIRISYSGEHKTRQDHSISTLYIMYIYIQTDVLLYRKRDVTFQPCVFVMQCGKSWRNTSHLCTGCCWERHQHRKHLESRDKFSVKRLLLR